MSAKRFHILQIFNRYLQHGGEEGSVYRIGDTLQTLHDVEYFFTSTRQQIETKSRVQAAVLALHNPEIAKRLLRYQALGGFHVWQIHNIFPVMSPVVYQIAFERKIPIIQYLHNYRMSCSNGFFLNHGQTCTRCIDGNFWPAFQTACWRNSHLQSGWIGLVLTRLRSLGVMTKVSAWVALSAAQKSLHVRMGVPEERIKIIPHFYELKNPVTDFKKRRNVIFIGRLSTEKGVHILLRAWNLLKTGCARLLIVGDGPQLAELQEIVSVGNIQNVDFLGFLPKEKQDEFWSQASVVVVPSVWQDPLPTVVFEAWERGCGVIVTAAGGLEDTVTDGVDGLKFDLGDIQQLASAIEKLLGDPLLAWKMGQIGQQKVKENYSKQRWLLQMAEVYDSVVVQR